jgi:8-oxo-dGTP diphosphatase
MPLPDNPVHVAAAVVENRDGAVLLTRRPAHVHQGGLWEFPGGKLEPGEPVAAALRRELAEELGIEVQAHRPLIRVRHDYAERAVLLDVHRVTRYAGEPRGLEGQPLRWVLPPALGDYPMPAADRPIVSAIRLPSAYLVTPAHPGKPAAVTTGVRRALASGIRLVWLRVLQTGFPTARVAGLLAADCREAGADLLVSRDIELAREAGCGVHLGADQLRQLRARPLPGDRWVAASCHSPVELRRAVELAVDFAVLSPVAATSSHPGRVPLGWPRFRSWVDGLPLPVFALGGMGPADIATAWRYGGQGVAGISGFWPHR